MKHRGGALAALLMTAACASPAMYSAVIVDSAGEYESIGPGSYHGTAGRRIRCLAAEASTPLERMRETAIRWGAQKNDLSLVESSSELMWLIGGQSARDMIRLRLRARQNGLEFDLEYLDSVGKSIVHPLADELFCRLLALVNCYSASICGDAGP